MRKLKWIITALAFTAALNVLAWRDLETGTFLTRDPIGYADGPNVYCYVHGNPITQFDPFGLEVLSAARDLDGVAAGKHHFVIVRPDNPKDFPLQKQIAHTTANKSTPVMLDLGDGTKGFTVGAHNVNGRLQVEYNQGADFEAAREYANPKVFMDALKPDFSTEAHTVDTPKGKSDTKFITELMKNTKNYSENESKKNILYPTKGQNILGKGRNSNSWEASLLESAGAKGHGNFKGMDKGWNLRLAPSVFAPPPPVKKNQNSSSASMSQSAAQQQAQSAAQQPTPPPQPTTTQTQTP